MTALNPNNTTWGDLCTAALQECGALGTGQTATAEDMNKAWARGQWMLQEWQQKRWLVYHLVTYSIVSTGAVSYTFGPGGQINTNVVAAWGLSALAPMTGLAGTGYGIGEVLTLSAQPASGTPSAPQQAQVLTVDGGGAVLTVQTNIASYGYVQFPSNPIDGDTITLDGVVWTFKLGGATGNQTNIQATADLTVAQLAADLSASTNANVSLASYGVTGTLGTSDLRLRILYNATGTEGNAFTLAASSATVSGATLTGGVANPAVYPGPLPNTWNQASTTGVGFGLVLGFPTWNLSAVGITKPSGSQRPPKIEAAFMRQIQISQPNQVDYPLDILQSKEDYDRIALKNLQSFGGAVFLDSQWPLGTLFCYPVPQANIYSINVTVMEQLHTSFATLATAVNLPFEYYSAILYNLALRLRPVFQIPTYPGDPLQGLATNALNTLRGPNTQIARLHMPAQLVRPGIYNIFSDRNY